MKRYILFLCLFMLMFSRLPAEVVEFRLIDSTSEWEKVLEEASETEKVIFVDLYADWCAYCRKMQVEVFTDDELADYHNEHFINVKIDSDTEFGDAFSFMHEVEAFPTCLYFHADNYIIKTLVGYTDVDELMDESVAAAIFKFRFPELQRLYSSQDISNVELAELICMTGKVENNELNNLLLEFSETRLDDGDYANEFVLEVIALYFYEVSNPMVSKVLELNEDIKNESMVNFYTFYQQVFDQNMDIAIKEKSEQRLLELIGTLNVYLPKDELLSGEYHVWSMYFEETQQYNELLVHISFYAESSYEPAEVYYDAAYNILESSWDNENMLELALQLMEYYKKESDSDFNYYLTSGVIYAYLGRGDLAEKHLNKARKEAPDSESEANVEEILAFVKQLP